MRFAIVAFALAISQQACIATGLAGIHADDQHADQSAVAPQESDARLRCDGAPCQAAPVEQTWKEGRSRTVFWSVFAGELVMAAAGAAVISSGDGAGNIIGGILMINLGWWGAFSDILTYVRAQDYGRQDDPPRLAKPVIADYRGAQVPLRIADVWPLGGPQPATFSVAAAAKRMPQQAAAAVPAGAKLTHGKVAVLDLKSSAKDVSPEDVRYFGDLVRAATLKAAPQLEVMTRENLLVLLQSSGKDLGSCEGECEVDTGRRIGADAIVSGEVLKVGTRYKLTLRLHETHDGKLLGATVASGRNLDELDDAVTKAAMELFGAGK